MDEMPINWISVLISTVIPMITGFIYYHPKLAGTAWMESIGMTEEKQKQANMPKVFGISLVMAFLLSMFLVANVNGALQEGAFDTFKHGAAHGAILGFLVAMPLFVTNGLFQQATTKNMIINVIYWVITLALMGGVLDAMNTWSITVGG